MAINLSTKRIQIDKANRTIIIVLAVSVFVTVFSMFISKALLAKRSHQSKIISGKELALKQLKANVTAVDSLNDSYRTFVSTPQNVIGGSTKGTGDRDGDNAKIVLDALPSKYDFPALATSLEKILSDKQYAVGTISGTDDELAQSGVPSEEADAAVVKDATKVEPVAIPFSIGVTGTYASLQGLLKTLEKSIRPIQVTSVLVTGDDSSLQIEVTANTYYQSEKVYSISTKDVK